MPVCFGCWDQVRVFDAAILVVSGSSLPYVAGCGCLLDELVIGYFPAKMYLLQAQYSSSTALGCDYHL